jgi:hypothetical protein
MSARERGDSRHFWGSSPLGDTKQMFQMQMANFIIPHKHTNNQTFYLFLPDKGDASKSAGGLSAETKIGYKLG